MGAGSAALLWYACCCSFVFFCGILATLLVIKGRRREERARLARERAFLQQMGDVTATSAAPVRPGTPPEPATESRAEDR